MTHYFFIFFLVSLSWWFHHDLNLYHTDFFSWQPETKAQFQSMKTGKAPQPQMFHCSLLMFPCALSVLSSLRWAPCLGCQPDPVSTTSTSTPSQRRSLASSEHAPTARLNDNWEGGGILSCIMQWSVSFKGVNKHFQYTNIRVFTFLPGDFSLLPRSIYILLIVFDIPNMLYLPCFFFFITL